MFFIIIKKVEHTKNASEKVLEELLLQRMNRMLALGTTTAEAKSGYGLECETEMKVNIIIVILIFIQCGF